MEISQIWLPLLLTVLAGLSTGLGSLISLFVKKFKKSYLSFSLGLSAGVMIYVSLIELLPGVITEVGFLNANLVFFIGVLFILIIDFFIPHDYIEEKPDLNRETRGLMRAGILTALGIAIHNFPEGVVVFLSGLSDIKLGIPLAFAIALHNIPEGVAVSMPIYYATKNRWKAFWYSFGSGIVEPIAALIAILVLLPFLNIQVLNYALAFAAGIMVFISFDELLPLCFCEGKDRIAISGIIIGMLVMAVSLYFL